MEIKKDCCFKPGHFYSPIVNTEDVSQRSADIWPTVPQIEGIDFNDQSHQQILKEWFPEHIAQYDYPEMLPDNPDLANFFTGNGQFSHLDARTLFVILKELRPKKMIEVGAGFSSLLTADVNRRFLDLSMEFICIEPYPRPFLEKKIEGISQLVKERVEKVPYEMFAQLERGDILFIDSSHVSKTGSDVNYLYFEVLPRLKPGVIVHIHDIFLPHDYPKQWVLEHNRSWNEQYLLRAMLTHSTRFRVLFGSRYAAYRFPELVASALADPNGRCLSGGSFWIERV